MKKINSRPYILTRELQAIIEQMGSAMMNADVKYVKGGRMTPAMKIALAWYYMWAEDAYAEGM